MIPEFVNIGCYEYLVEQTDKPIIVDGSECLGSFSPLHQTLRIKSDVSEQTKEQTFWHEVIHAILDYYRIDFEEMEKEDVVDVLGTGLYALMKANGALPGQEILLPVWDE